MTRTLFVVLAAFVVACSEKESPFKAGVPPAAIVESFLSACQVRDDRRDPGVSGNPSVAGSGEPMMHLPPDRSYRGPNCRVSLEWRGSRIEGISVTVRNNGPFFEEFVRKAVLPLLKPRASLIVREEMLDHLATGPREKKRTRVPGGVVATELEWWNGPPGAPFLTAAELSIALR